MLGQDGQTPSCYVGSFGRCGVTATWSGARAAQCLPVTEIKSVTATWCTVLPPASRPRPLPVALSSAVTTVTPWRHTDSVCKHRGPGPGTGPVRAARSGAGGLAGR